MKAIILNLFSALTIIIYSFTQTKVDYNKLITEDHTKVIEQVHLIINIKSRNSKEIKNHLSVVNERLNGAMKSIEKLKVVIPQERKEVFLPFIAAIRTYHVQATYYSWEIKETLRQTAYSDKLIMAHAKKLNDLIEKAEKENVALRLKLEE
jgi:hypothetical protein